MKYIPQGPPFVMIDEIISATENQTVCTFEVKATNLFTNDEGQFLEAGLVEHMAQTAAAGTGLKASKNQENPPVGFIGQIKNLKIFALPKVGSILTTVINEQQQVMNALLVNGVVQCEGVVIAQADFKIFLQS